MASRTEWQPAHDEEDVVHMSDGAGRVFKLVYGGKSDEAEYIVLTDKLCICKRVSVPAAPAVPPDIAETIREALIKRRDNLEDMIDTFRSYVDDADLQRFRDAIERNSVALQWLAAQKGGE